MPPEHDTDAGSAAKAETRQPAGGLLVQLVRHVVRVVDAVSWSGMVVGGAGLIVMLIYVTTSVLGRYTGLWTLSSADQVAAYLMAGLFFLCLAYTFRVGGFIIVAPLRKRIPPKVRPALETIHLVVALIYVGVLTYYVWATVVESRQHGTSTFGLIEWPLWIPQLVMPIGCAVLFLQIASLLLARVFLGKPAPSGAVSTV